MVDNLLIRKFISPAVASDHPENVFVLQKAKQVTAYPLMQL